MRSTPSKTIPTRIACVISTTAGAILVQDKKDRRLPEVLSRIRHKSDDAERRGNNAMVERMKHALQIAQQGRFSLPGGGIDMQDYEQAGATSLIGMDMRDINKENQIQLFREVIRRTVMREIKEELNLSLDPDHLEPILEINGVTRNHIICLGLTQGAITLNANELNGIGFLPDKPQIPLNYYFYQAHVRELYKRSMSSSNRNPNWKEIARNYLSKIKVPIELIHKWFGNINSVPGYLGGLEKYLKRHPTGFPKIPTSNPNFTIINPDGSTAYNDSPSSLTLSATAKIVPAYPWEKKS